MKQRGPRPGASKVERVMLGLTSAITALNRARQRVARWSNAVGADHEDALDLLRRALHDSHALLTTAFSAAQRLERGRFIPHETRRTVTPLSVGDHVRLTPAAAKRWQAMGGVAHRLALRDDLYVRYVQGKLLGLGGGRDGEVIAVLNRANLEPFQ